VSDFLILGCGFTGARVARRLLARGHRVTVTTRDPARIDIPGVAVVALDAGSAESVGELTNRVQAGVRVLHSVPLLKTAGGLADPTPLLLEPLRGRADRVVYLSTTGVYGPQRDVDESTSPIPRTPRETLRVDAERLVGEGPWSAMVLRPAAIYGPGRGMHVSMQRGEFRLWGDGSNFVSRIHVDDLAALAEAALLAEHAGAWPVADEHPATSREVAEFVCRLLAVEMPAPAVDALALDETRRANRRVDGRAVCRLLGVKLAYRSYLQGIPASLGVQSNI
jgi:nucleoside-diphosphate-sugar epimerase